MKYLIFLLLAFSAPASAQTAWTSTSTIGVATCEAGGEKWLERGSVCHADRAFRDSHGLTSQGGASVTGRVMRCRDGYLPVLRQSGHPACARDVVDAE